MRSTVVIAATLLFIVADAPAAERAPIVITGMVVDVEEAPISGVIVSAWWGTGSESATTNPQGAYRLTIEPGRPVTTLYFDKAGEAWALAYIQYLSGSRSHEINKVLHRANPGRLALAPALEALSAYESIYYQSGGGERGLPEGAAERYKTFLRDLELAESIPGSVLERLFQVQRLWGLSAGFEDSDK